MHFPVHVRVSVCVNVRVDLGVDFRVGRCSSLGEEELLLCQVLLIVRGAHAVFVRAGGQSHAAPVPLPIRRPVGALQYLRSCGWSTGRGRAVLPALAKPQQHCAKDEHYSSRDANDDRPGEGAGGWREHGHDGRLCVWEGRGKRNQNRFATLQCCHDFVSCTDEVLKASNKWYFIFLFDCSFVLSIWTESSILHDWATMGFLTKLLIFFFWPINESTHNLDFKILKASSISLSLCTENVKLLNLKKTTQ